jgi:hypothetical protein
VWNATVANLTLMALGSSAPEIILSVIETVSSGFYSGALGPSTIVGSAAFNLFCVRTPANHREKDVSRSSTRPARALSPFHFIYSFIHSSIHPSTRPCVHHLS